MKMWREKYYTEHITAHRRFVLSVLSTHEMGGTTPKTHGCVEDSGDTEDNDNRNHRG